MNHESTHGTHSSSNRVQQQQRLCAPAPTPGDIAASCILCAAHVSAWPVAPGVRDAQRCAQTACLWSQGTQSGMPADAQGGLCTCCLTLTLSWPRLEGELTASVREAHEHERVPAAGAAAQPRTQQALTVCGDHWLGVHRRRAITPPQFSASQGACPAHAKDSTALHHGGMTQAMPA